MFHKDYHLQDISRVEDRSLEFIGSPGVLLTFSGEGQLIFIGRQNIFELNFFTKKNLSWSNQVGKIFLTDQFSQYLSVNVKPLFS